MIANSSESFWSATVVLSLMWGSGIGSGLEIMLMPHRTVILKQLYDTIWSLFWRIVRALRIIFEEMAVGGL